MIFSPGEPRKIIHCNLMQSCLGAIQNPCVAVVIHNTRSCSKIVWDAYQVLGEKYHHVTGKNKSSGYIFSTGLTDQDAVFGATEKLRECVMDIIDEIHPEVILVACGCVPGVIGDDTEEVCQAIEMETKVPVILLPGHGFMVPGLVDTVTSMSRLLFDTWTRNCIAEEKKSDTCVVVGLSPAYSSKEEYRELMEILRLLGFTHVICPPVGTDKEQYEEIGKAAVVISFVKGCFLEKAAKELAQYMAQALQIPLIDWNQIHTPEESGKLYISLGKRWGKEREMIQFCKEKEQLLVEEIQKAKAIFAGKSCSIRLGIARQAAYLDKLIALLRDMGMPSIHIQLSDMITREEEAMICKSFSGVSCQRENKKADVMLSTVPFDLRKSEEILLPSCLGYDGWIHFIRQLCVMYGGAHE